MSADALATSLPILPIEGGSRLRVRVIPRSSADRIEGVEQDAAGASHLKVRVRAAPADGAANTALEALLAKSLGAPRSSVHVAKGAAARTKMVDIIGVEPASLARKLKDIVKG